MRIPRTLVGLAAVGVLTVGCGSSGNGSDSDATPSVSAQGADGEGAGAELPRKIEAAEDGLLGSSPELSPSPARGDTTANVLHELRVGTLKMAGAHGRTDAKCDGGALRLKAGVTNKCTVRYEGVEVPWKVTISDKYRPESSVLAYRAEPEKGVLTARAAYGLWYKLQTDEDREELRCSEIPDVELVELDRPTNYMCQYQLERNGEEEWSDRVISVTRNGVEFDLP